MRHTRGRRAAGGLPCAAVLLQERTPDGTGLAPAVLCWLADRGAAAPSRARSLASRESEGVTTRGRWVAFLCI